MALIESVLAAVLTKGAIKGAEYGLLNLKKVLTKGKRKGFYSIFKKDSTVIIIPSSFETQSVVFKVGKIKKVLQVNDVTGIHHAISLMLLTQFLSNFSLKLSFRKDDLLEAERDKNSLILTGSSSSNRVTKWFCEYMGKTASFSSSEDILWFNRRKIQTPNSGVIVCKIHPEHAWRRIVLLAGLSQYGTSAAIHFFAASELLDILRRKKCRGSWAALVHGKVDGGVLTDIQLDKKGIIDI